jgi:hypothetical protein
MREISEVAGSISKQEPVTSERDLDSLNSATGIVFNSLIGITLWLILAVLSMIFWQCHFDLDLEIPTWPTPSTIKKGLSTFFTSLSPVYPDTKVS